MTGPAGKPKATDSESGLPDQRDAAGPPPQETRTRWSGCARLWRSCRPSSRRSPPSAPTVPPGPRQGRWRPWVAGVLIACGALLAPLSVCARWAHDPVAETDRYIERFSPLATDPAVQAAVIDRITTEIITRLQVEASPMRRSTRSPPGPPAAGADQPQGAVRRSPTRSGLRRGAGHQARRVRRVRAGLGGRQPRGTHPDGRRADRQGHRHGRDQGQRGRASTWRPSSTRSSSALVERGFEPRRSVADHQRAVHDLPVRRHHQGPDCVPAPGSAQRGCRSSACLPDRRRRTSAGAAAGP